MVYRNERTGAVLETVAEIVGGGWQKVVPEEIKKPKGTSGKTPPKKANRKGSVEK